LGMALPASIRLPVSLVAFMDLVRAFGIAVAALAVAVASAPVVAVILMHERPPAAGRGPAAVAAEALDHIAERGAGAGQNPWVDVVIDGAVAISVAVAAELRPVAS